MKLIWTTPASKDLGNIFAYLNDLNQVAAWSIIERITGVALLLQEMPNIGKGRKGKELEKVVDKTNFTIFYVINDHLKTVAIVRVLHQSREIPDTEQEWFDFLM